MKRDEPPMPLDRAQDEMKGKPPHGASDGKDGGRSQGGKASPGNFDGDDTHGRNMQSGTRQGAESEETAPGISTDKKADDTK